MNENKLPASGRLCLVAGLALWSWGIIGLALAGIHKLIRG